VQSCGCRYAIAGPFRDAIFVYVITVLRMSQRATAGSHAALAGADARANGRMALPDAHAGDSR